MCRPSQFFTTAHLVEDNVGGGLPDERFGRVVPACKPRIDGAFQFFHRVEGAPPNHFVSDEPKPAFNLIEPGTAGGCEMEVKAAALLGLEPTLHGGALVGAVVVENEVDVEFRGHLLFQLMEEFDELLAPMARQATTDDLAIEDIEGGKQGGGSVPLVIMRLAFRQSRPVALFVWVLPAAVLLWNLLTWRGAGALNTYAYWMAVWNNYFADCVSSECLYQLFVTVPLYAAIAYSFGFFTGRFVPKN